VFPRLAAPATLHDLRSTLKLLYQKLSHERKFRFALVAALVLTLAWWYLDRSAAIVFNDDPYSILDLMDLTQPVSVKEIKKAYRRKSMQYHRYD
jgi:preprotein translocase subunit Sec63